MGIKVYAKKSNPFQISLTLINQIEECLYVAKFKNLNFSSKLRGLRCHRSYFSVICKSIDGNKFLERELKEN